MNDLFLIIFNKLPDEHYPLRRNTLNYKSTHKKLIELYENTKTYFQEIPYENLKHWAFMLQDVNLAIFTIEELLYLTDISLLNIFNLNTSDIDTYRYKRSDILYDFDGIIKNDNYDLTIVNNLYQAQIKPNYTYSKVWFRELFILNSF